MSDFALRTVGLGKMYHIGAEQEKNPTLRDALARAVRRPIERIRHPSAATGKSEVLWALRDVNLEVKYGEALGIIGRNGAGKSTLLRVLSHITEPTEGRVEIRGRVGSLLEVGTGFHPELTGRENIQLNGAILGMTRAEIKEDFDEIVEFSEIGRFLDTPVKHYSSGMYVRLAFAVAAHLRPEILVLDEVLAVGDISFQKKCLAKMQDVATQGRAVLFVSHNPAAVARLCQRTIILEEGRVMFDGDSEAALRTYIRTAFSEATRQVEFTDDPDLPIAFRRMKLTAANKSDADPLDITDSLCFEIDYRVARDVRGTNLGFSVKRDGVVLLRSWDIDNDRDVFELRRAGNYRSRVLLPSSLLCPGAYSVAVGAGRSGVGAFAQHDDCLTFELENSSCDATHHSLSRGGAFIVPVDWQTSSGDDDRPSSQAS